MHYRSIIIIRICIYTPDNARIFAELKPTFWQLFLPCPFARLYVCLSVCLP